MSAPARSHEVSSGLRPDDVDLLRGIRHLQERQQLLAVRGDPAEGLEQLGVALPGEEVVVDRRPVVRDVVEVVGHDDAAGGAQDAQALVPGCRRQPGAGPSHAGTGVPANVRSDVAAGSSGGRDKVFEIVRREYHSRGSCGGGY